MKSRRSFRLLSLSFLTAAATAVAAPHPIASPNLVFAEVDGVVTFEAEHFVKQELTSVRAFHIVSTVADPQFDPDADPSHAAGASGHAYLEILPDSRRNHDEELIVGENFDNSPGNMAVLSYRVHFEQPGRYYVWARVYSTGTEDNGMHVGLNGTWPESGQRWQTTLKDAWQWDSRQRTEEVHVGVPMQLWLDVPTAGEHTVQISMREDGFELDKVVLARDRDYVPADAGPTPRYAAGMPPYAFPSHSPLPPRRSPHEITRVVPKGVSLNAADVSFEGTNYYFDRETWAAINPEEHTTATVTATVPVGTGRYHVAFHAVGESDGQSTYELSLGGRPLGTFQPPLSTKMYEESSAYVHTWPNVAVQEGDQVEVTATIGSADGLEYARARWARIEFLPTEINADTTPYWIQSVNGSVSSVGAVNMFPAMTNAFVAQFANEVSAGFGQVDIPDRIDAVPVNTVHGELKQWHAVTLDIAGPFAHEQDLKPNPFTDYAYNVTFTHESGEPSYVVPGYFAADGDAANTGATSGTVWRAHLSPDKPGVWNYRISFLHGTNAATYRGGAPLAPYDGSTGSFTIAPTDKTAPDFRARGRLTYTGERYLRFAGDQSIFLKAGPDAPETFLAHTEFDNTLGLKDSVPLKTWEPHLRDWRSGDPIWANDRGKSIIGAINYLADKGMNVFSFLTYNAGGDGDNVWPFVDRDDKLHYDVSKLDQWDVLFAHAQARGIYLHFKLQENELDDHRAGQERTPQAILEAMDAGETGPERRLYFREMIARFGHHLALNWNFGEENTQTYAEQVAMFDYVAAIDPYGHHRVIHTFPQDQDRVYNTLLGDRSNLTGPSMQNRFNQAHARTRQWLDASAAAGRQWVVANDEQNPFEYGVPPDPGYRGFNGIADADRSPYTLHDIRKYTLWGNLMAGGAGVEYYFGYRLAENDLLLQDLRSRDQTWDYCRIALEFFHGLGVDLNTLSAADELVGTAPGENGNWCLARSGEFYLVYLPEGEEAELDLGDADGQFSLEWFNPRNGQHQPGATVAGGRMVRLTPPANVEGDDWAVVLRRAP